MGAYDLLSVVRIKGIWDELKDVRVVSKDYRWVAGNKDSKPLLYGVGSAGARIPIYDMLWGEIFARFTDRVTIAPIIGYNAQTPMKTLGPTVRLEQTNIPKIKTGAEIPEETLIMIRRIQANLEQGLVDNMSTKDDVTVFTNYLMGQTEKLAEGTLARLEHMAIGMLTGSYTYNDPNVHGMILNMTWQMAAEAKVTASTAWGDGTFGLTHATAGATPVSDYWSMRQTWQTKYGTRYTRASMSLQALVYVFGTTEFKSLAPLYMARYNIAPAAGNISIADTDLMTTVLEYMWNLKIELDDRQVQVDENDLANWVAPPGTPASGQYIRYQPANIVIFTNAEDDGNRDIWDIGNAPVMEAMPGLIPGIVGESKDMASFGNTFGPFTYVSAANINGDPPGLNMYAVRNALARRKQLLCSAAWTVF